jgi:tetratricopeptide (TPR) repeat protein
VTRFCEVVTPRDTDANLDRARLATKEMGEAMAPASEPTPAGSGAGAAPLVAGALLAVLVACGGSCGEDAQPRSRPAEIAAADRAAADPARGITTELDGASPAFGEALLAELTGDLAAARAGFERVLAASDTPAALAARAALHLAQLESRTGKSRRALDLVARASALAPSDVAIAEGVAELQADVVAAAGAGDLRGPRLGTPLPGVEPRVAEAFAAAERALEQVHKLRPRPLIEALSRSIRVKEEATEAAVQKYRAVAEHGGLAQIAASYRAGSLYHDLALGLLFELPPELDPAVAAGLRRTLRVRAVAYLKKAATEYRSSLAAPKHPDDELWRLAAETDLRGARDVLGEAGER